MLASKQSVGKSTLTSSKLSNASTVAKKK